MNVDFDAMVAGVHRFLNSKSARGASVKKFGAQIGSAALLSIATSAYAALGDLSTVPYVTYGDGRSFSLPISQLICEQSGGSNCSDFSVASTPGNIKDLVVIATGAEGKDVTTNFAGMDNAYSTPNSTNAGPYFQTDPTTSRGSTGTINNNDPNTWDSSLFALKTFLSGENPVFFFNNNQTDSGASTNQNLAAWARLSITDAAGNEIVIGSGGATGLLFTNRNEPYAIVPDGGGIPSQIDPNANTAFSSNATDPIAGTNLATDYVLSGGEVCLNGSFVPVPCSGPHAFGPINHNLGADHVAYAVIFPELNAALASLFGSLTDAQLDNYTFHLDLRLGCDPDLMVVSGKKSEPGPECVGRTLNNGYEQLFLATVSGVTEIPVPVPGTLLLIGGVLGLLPFFRGRRPNATAV